MGDMGDDFRAMRKHWQEKRESNREQSTARLTREGVVFESKNDGIHLIVEGRVDYWPSTGRWIERANRRRHRGIKSLLAFLRKPA